MGSASGLTLLAVSACTSAPPQPTPTVPPTRTKIPQPSAFERSSWASDPFSRGALSFQPVGSSPEQRAALGEPVAGRLFFAGEHTADFEPGTVQGARASGLRVALELADVVGERERIAVVGAGIAGATVARRLADAGHSVVVVEGRDRSGGRIRTVDDERWPAPIELGAAWVHDASTNPVTSALARAEVSTSSFDFVYDRRTAAGASIEAGSVAPDAVAAAIAWAASQPGDVSIADALVASGAADVSSSRSPDGVSDADLLENFVAGDVVIEGGAEADELSAWFTADPTRSTDDDVLVTGGFAGLVTSELDGLDILPSSTVSSVSYDNDGVSLRLARGESLSADRVVITVPLGVLKAGSIEFDPPLPFAHRGAISALGMGQQEKIVLRFDAPFWSTDATVWSVIDGDSDFPLWYNLLPLTGEPMLVGICAGEAATRLAEFSDADLLQAALTSLEPFLDPEVLEGPGGVLPSPSGESGAAD
ncbi:monoamine oxidase [Homoserinimonas aerilata]|uniref:Monoamine oxidase n=2 Tax=Homoserinimonas aerilata TaxID=1162970 RepID=A0A542YJA9_9MICO|nr:monoamine oxidase [Homoserinimonas aerilata]